MINMKRMKLYTLIEKDNIEVEEFVIYSLHIEYAKTMFKIKF